VQVGSNQDCLFPLAIRQTLVVDGVFWSSVRSRAKLNSFSPDYRFIHLGWWWGVGCKAFWPCFPLRSVLVLIDGDLRWCLGREGVGLFVSCLKMKIASPRFASSFVYLFFLQWNQFVCFKNKNKNSNLLSIFNKRIWKCDQSNSSN